jgi:hypothetical protein
MNGTNRFMNGSELSDYVSRLGILGYGAPQDGYAMGYVYFIPGRNAIAGRVNDSYGITVRSISITNGSTLRAYVDYWNTNVFMGRTETAFSVGGYIYEGLEKLTYSNGYWLGKNGKYYKTYWGGNQHTGGRSGALKVAKGFKWGGVVTTIAAGGIDLYVGYKEDGNTFGYNAQKSLAGTAGGIGGAAAGASIGAAIGTPFAGVGAVPGAIIGGIIGSIGGGIGGSYAGKATFDLIY